MTYSFLCLCLCLGFILSEEQSGNIITVQADGTGASFIFVSQKFDANDYMYFKVRALEKTFSNVPYPVEYAYVKDQGSERPTSGIYSTNFTGNDTETLQNNTKLDIKFFTIQKKTEQYNSQNGNYLYINIKVSLGTFVEIISQKSAPSVPSGIMDTITPKYGTAYSNADEYMVVFDVSDFNEGEEMYFKIKARYNTFLWNYIFYEYIDKNKDYSDKDTIQEFFSLKSEYEKTPNAEYTTRYFTIKKEKKIIKEPMEIIY